jgi:hypothetical protein
MAGGRWIRRRQAAVPLPLRAVVRARRSGWRVCLAFGVYQYLKPPAPVSVYAVAFDGRTLLVVEQIGRSCESGDSASWAGEKPLRARPRLPRPPHQDQLNKINQ